jgi:hypothetical protein
VSERSERSGRLSEPDRALLADYVGGALDGTPDEAAVAALVESDPDWAAALEDMLTALAAVDADLAAYAAISEPMPADLTARLEAALAAAAERTAEPDHGGGRTTDPVTVGRSRGRLTVVPTDRPAGARRRRWRTWAAGVGAAAALIACAGVSINWYGQQRSGTTSADTAAAGNAAAPERAGSAADTAGMAVTASGRTYTRFSLTESVTPLLSPGTKSAPQPAAPSGDRNRAETGSTTLAAPLARLQAPAALDSCLAAVALAHGRGALTIQSVDYGTFERSPAVIVFFTDPAGERWAWASGPNCGVAGPDTLYRTRVA